MTISEIKALADPVEVLHQLELHLRVHDNEVYSGTEHTYFLERVAQLAKVSVISLRPLDQQLSVIQLAFNVETLNAAPKLLCLHLLMHEGELRPTVESYQRLKATAEHLETEEAISRKQQGL